MSAKIPGGEIHVLPSDMREAIIASTKIEHMWSDITSLARNEWICWIESAKKSETRDRRIRIMLDQMRVGKRRPCCWAGCPHRK